MSKFWSFLSRQSPPSPARPAATVQDDGQARAAPSPEERVIAMISRECPAFSAADMQTPFDRLGIDSVGMLMIHTSVEEATDNVFDNRRWDDIVTPADLVNALRAATTGDSSRRQAATADERRSCLLNMPQMALGGLSERWLFTELGDMHWSILANAFDRPSHLFGRFNSHCIPQSMVGAWLHSPASADTAANGRLFHVYRLRRQYN